MWWPLLLLPACLALRDLEPPPPLRDAATFYEDEILEGYVDVRLDHFHAQNTDTFPMRYFFNRQIARANDIVIFVGGEWAISEGWLRAGLPYDLALMLQAGLFYTEHRYYGLTRPTTDTSVDNLRYLTIDQALGDLAQFIDYVRSDEFEHGQFKDGKVALIGCSYAGTMATWMRLGYPHLVQVAYSDSGPLHAQEDFPEYLEVITEALRSQGGEACLTSVEDAMRQLDDLLGTAAGAQQISTMFNTCTPLAANTPLDVATLHWFGITETFAYLVQYATPGDIPEACAALTATSVSTSALQRLATWVTAWRVAQPWLPEPCIETRYTEVVAAHQNTSYDAPDAVMRLWTYQTCVEFGWYQTTSSSAQPFLESVPLEYFHQMCRDIFSNYFDEDVLRRGIERTNIMFGGLSFLPDRVITVQGGHDPWSPMGPNATHATTFAPVYVVPETSHCRALGTLFGTDEAELEAVKLSVMNQLTYHMAGFFYASATAVAPTVVMASMLAVLVLGL